jgi:hypothetical protein
MAKFPRLGLCQMRRVRGKKDWQDSNVMAQAEKFVGMAPKATKQQSNRKLSDLFFCQLSSRWALAVP